MGGGLERMNALHQEGGTNQMQTTDDRGGLSC